MRYRRCHAQSPPPGGTILFRALGGDHAGGGQGNPYRCHRVVQGGVCRHTHIHAPSRPPPAAIFSATHSRYAGPVALPAAPPPAPVRARRGPAPPMPAMPEPQELFGTPLCDPHACLPTRRAPAPAAPWRALHAAPADAEDAESISPGLTSGSTTPDTEDAPAPPLWGGAPAPGPRWSAGPGPPPPEDGAADAAEGRRVAGLLQELLVAQRHWEAAGRDVIRELEDLAWRGLLDAAFAALRRPRPAERAAARGAGSGAVWRAAALAREVEGLRHDRRFLEGSVRQLEAENRELRAALAAEQGRGAAQARRLAELEQRRARRRVTFADPMLAPPAPRPPPDTGFAALEARQRGHVTAQEADQREWLRRGLLSVVLEARREGLCAAEADARAALAARAARESPVTPECLAALLAAERAAAWARLAAEERRAWAGVCAAEAAEVARVPWGLPLGLLRGHRAGARGLWRSEAAERDGLVRRWELAMGQTFCAAAARRCAVRVVEVWEHQRWLPFWGWAGRLLPHDPPPFAGDWAPGGGFEGVAAALAAAGAAWAGEWEVDGGAACGAGGWQYGPDFASGAFRAAPGLRSAVRRRKWYRPCVPRALAPPAPAPAPPPAPGCFESWQEVGGRVCAFTAAGLRLVVPASYAAAVPVELAAARPPSVLLVEPLGRAGAGGFGLRDARSGWWLFVPQRDRGDGLRLLCGPKPPGKEAARLELVYAAQRGRFHVRVGEARFWRADGGGAGVEAVGARELAGEFCLAKAP